MFSKFRTPYNQSFFDAQRQGSYRSAQIVAPFLIDLFHPKSVIDIGCGVGTWLKAFSERGITEVVGVDGNYLAASDLEISTSQFMPHDLTIRVETKIKYGLAVCLEVGEHLPTQFSETLTDSLTDASDVVVFSAAIPHQPGTGHVNCQWQSYWAALFDARGFACFDIVRPKIWMNSSVDYWYKQNILVYIRRGTQFSRVAEPSNVSFIDLVHPDLYESAIYGNMGLKRLIQKLPSAIGSAIGNRLG